MAATWKQSITTSAGIALMNKAYGVSSIIPTKAVTITDDISGLSVTQVMALTSVNYNQSRVPIVISNQANTTRIGIDIDNKDVNEQYDYYGIGVYFKQVNTGEEVLFSVIPLSGADTIIPNQSGVATSSISIDSYTSIVPGTNVELTVSDSGSVTRGDVEQIVAANQSFSFPKKPLATGIDLQSIKSIGIYQVNDDKTVVNAPDGFSGNGYLIVVGDGTTANPIVQEITDTATGNKSINVYNSSLNKWDGWQQFSYKSYVDDSIKSANEYTDNGLATKADDSKVVHTADMRKAPSDVAGIEEVNVKADDSKVVHDNHDGTEQLNGVQVQPFNKLSDTIGGRNLLTGTGNNTVTGSTTKGYLSNETTDDLLTLFKGLEGQTLTVSVDYKYSGFVAGSGTSRLGWETQINAGTTAYFGAWYSPDYYPNDSGSGRISKTFVVPKNITSVGGSRGNIQFSGSGTGTLSHLKLEKGSVATDWSPAPEDKVNVADMRKLASDVAGIEEVNAKQDKIGYTPADDSTVLHNSTKQVTGTDMNTLLTGGYYQVMNGTNVFPGADSWTIYQVIPLNRHNGVQIAYETNNTILGRRSWNYTSGNLNFTSWVQFAEDSTVAHLSGANNFDTTPTVNNNPLLLASSLPSDLARTSQQTNFTAGLKSGGIDVATAADLKSIEDASWRELNFDVSQGNYKAFSAAKIVYKINRDEKYISFFFAGTPSHVGNKSSNSTLVTDTTSLVMDLSSVLTEISGINFQTEYGQISDNNSHAASLGYVGAKVVFTSQVFIPNYLVGVTFLPKDYPDCRIYYTSLVNGI